MTLSWMQGLDDGRILYSTYIEALLQALNGKYVLSGLSCSTDGESLNVNIEAGTVRYDGVDYNYAGGSVTLNTGEDDRDRVDVIVWDYNGGSPTISVLQGIRWLNIGGSLKPMSERISDTQIPLALVIVRAGATSIEVADVYDVRVNMVAKLSDLQIDADKDWNGKSIYNVNEITTTGNVDVGGDLVVNGTQIILNTEILEVVDNIITLNSNVTSGAPVLDAGIEVRRGDEPTVTLKWNEATNEWELTEDGTNYHKIWHEGNDGSGSGLDADTVDGLDSSQFLRKDVADTKTGDLTLDGELFPKQDATSDLGSSSLRWANIYGVNVYAGDLCFEEKECAVCGQPFEVDDEIVLKAYKIDKYTRTVPIHLRCSKAYKELEARLKLIEEKDGGGV